MKHLSYRLLPLLAATSLATGCVASLEAKTAPAPANAPIAAAAPAPKPEDEQEQRKKVRAVEAARLEFDIAKLAADSARASAKAAQGTAERELNAVKAEREHFKKVSVALDLDAAGLGVDRAKQSVAEAEQELKELEGMYAAEKFAEATKELVLARGKAQLEFARRDLDLEQRKLEELKGFEHKKRDRELGERETKAKLALEQAKSASKKTDLEQRLALARAAHALEDAERAAPGVPKADPEAKAKPAEKPADKPAEKAPAPKAPEKEVGKPAEKGG